MATTDSRVTPVIRRTASAALCALALLVTGCATASHRPSGSGVRWIRVELAHVVLETNATPDVAQSFAREVEDLATAMLAVVLAGGRPPRRLEVIAVRDDELASLHPTFAGFFEDRRYIGPILVVGARGGASDRLALRRELARAVVSLGLHRVPEWLREGLVANLETLRIDRPKATATWGAITSAEIDEWRAGRVSIEALAQQPWQTNERRHRVLASKVLVHMLARRHQAQWECLVRGLSELATYEDRLDRCFPSRVGWESEYLDGVSTGPGVVIGEVPVPVATPKSPVVTLDRPDADVAFALVSDEIRRSIPPDDPRHTSLSSAFSAHLESALAGDPTNVRAALLKWMSTSSERPEFDGQAYGRMSAQLVAAHPDDWRAWCWRADLVSTPLAELRQALARASVLAPDRAEVVELLAYDAVRQDRWEEAAQFAWRAFTLRPSEPIAWNLVYATLEWLGRCNEARAFLASSSEIDRWVRDNLKLHEGRTIRRHHCIEP